MFEDFSFTSPSSRPSRLALDSEDHLTVDADSNLISPLSSRCPSPQHRFRSRSRYRQPPTSVPFPYTDPKRLSIATLTQKLHEHTLSPDHSYPGYVLTPPDTDHSDDGHSLSSPSSTTSPTFPPDLDLDLDLPSDLPDLPALGLPFSDVRAQRQQISRLQCNDSELEAMQRSLRESQVEDCHPSSLPPRASPRRRALTLARSRFGPEERVRRKSSVGGVLSSRVEKQGQGRRNEQGLRRKSLVSAALASMGRE